MWCAKFMVVQVILPFTALGTFRGIEASCLKVFGERSVKGSLLPFRELVLLVVILGSY